MGTNQMTHGRGRGQKFLKQNVEAPLSVRLTIGKLGFRVGRNKVLKNHLQCRRASWEAGV